MHPLPFHIRREKGVRKESERNPKDSYSRRRACGQNLQIASMAAVNWDFSV